MIRDLPQTTTAVVAKLLVRLRDEGVLPGTRID